MDFVFIFKICSACNAVADRFNRTNKVFLHYSAIVSPSRIPTLQHLREEKESLIAAKNDQYEEYSYARAKQKELQTVVTNLDKVLSEKDRIDREPSASLE